MPNEVTRLPMPDRLEPKQTKRSLMLSVRNYFYSLYNGANNIAFKKHLGSVGNNDSETGNRLFDRHVAVGMVKKAASDAKDILTTNAKDGDVYRCIVNLMRQNDMGLKLRRNEYKRLTQAPAE